MPKKAKGNTTRKTTGQGSGQGSGQGVNQNLNSLQDYQIYSQILSSNPNQQFLSQFQNQQFNPNQQFIPNPQFNPTLQTQPFPSQFIPNSQFNPTQQTQESSDDDDDEEDVEEIQVEQPETRGKKKMFQSRARAASWDPLDEERLAKAWVHISQCKKKGAEQKADSFWSRILKHYISLGGDASRSYHSINTKWNKMNTEMSFFNGLHIQAERLIASGCNDLDVMKRARSDYVKARGKAFKHEPAWDVVKKCDKWKRVALLGDTVATSSSGQKRKSTDSMHDQTASNDDDFDFQNLMPDMNENPTPTISRKGKKKQDEPKSLESIAETLSGYTITKRNLFEEQAARKKEKDELIMIDLKERIKARDRKIFMEPHENITNARLLAFTLQSKAEIAEKYGWVKYWEDE